jgi:hypothetical protein
LNLLSCYRRFHSAMSSHHFDPPSPGFAWRTKRRAAEVGLRG